MQPSPILHCSHLLCIWLGCAMLAVVWKVDTAIPSALSIILSQCHPRNQICQNWNLWHRRYSTSAPPIQARRWPISTILTSCHPISARPTKLMDKLYRRTGFASERERVEHLFMLYEKIGAPLKAAMQEKQKRRRVQVQIKRRGAVMGFLSVRLAQHAWIRMVQG